MPQPPIESVWALFLIACSGLVSIIIWLFVKMRSEVDALPERNRAMIEALNSSLKADISSIRYSVNSIEHDLREGVSALDRRVTVIETKMENGGAQHNHIYMG